MSLLMSVVGALMIVGGFVTSARSRDHRNEHALSTPWYRSGWHLPWNAPDYYTKTGMKLYIATYFLFIGGITIILLSRGVVTL